MSKLKVAAVTAEVSQKFLEVFDETGQLRKNVSPDEVAALSADQQREWKLLNEAAEKEQAAEAVFREHEKAVADLGKTEMRLYHEVRRLQPPISAVAMARAAAETYRTGKSTPPVVAKLAPEVQARLNELNTRLDTVSAQLSAERAQHWPLKAIVNKSREELAAAITRWQTAAAPPKKTNAQLMAEVNAAHANDHEGRARQQAAASAQPVSPLDQILKGSRGKRGRAFAMGKAR